jgi:putative addiction module component (TIGR02574 family)
VANASVRQVLELAKSLSAADRASVARDLLATLDYPGAELSSDAAEAAWRTEARRRAEAILRGETRGLAAEEVHARLKSRLDK